MRPEVVEPTTVQAVAGGALGVFVAILSEASVQLLGVGLPVVIAAAGGALIARSYLPPVGFFRALWYTGLWTIAGCVLAPVAQIVGAKIGTEIPGPALAGIALIVAGAAPFVWPVLIETLPGIAKRWLGRYGEKRNDQP
jgi:hypothetical protein